MFSRSHCLRWLWHPRFSPRFTLKPTLRVFLTLFLALSGLLTQSVTQSLTHPPTHPLMTFRSSLVAVSRWGHAVFPNLALCCFLHMLTFLEHWPLQPGRLSYQLTITVPLECVSREAEVTAELEKLACVSWRPHLHLTLKQSPVLVGNRSDGRRNSGDRQSRLAA